ncbi:response regulator transcription factor [Tannockella kyphosi]|uniref:response regulator transcription factor n=1 Tax=Tannockella kyphosi TaxID=2899121 RepID=UPI0020110D4D|nr:response regulator transcription factor [Tannockella kyphosi]
MAKILLVEDNLDIMNFNTSLLTMKGYEVLCATTLKKCGELLSFHQVDLIVLDIMLPDGNGLDYCKVIKEKTNTPILMLSALGENKDVIAGLKAGGDDYLAKPYDFEIFLARIEARLRSVETQNRFIYFGNLKLDTESMTANLEGEDLYLTKKEFSVLLVLAKNPNSIVDKEKLYESVWGVPMSGDSSALWTVISRLKKKLNAELSGVTISLQRSEGYILEKF